MRWFSQVGGHPYIVDGRPSLVTVGWRPSLYLDPLDHLDLHLIFTHKATVDDLSCELPIFILPPLNKERTS